MKKIIYIYSLLSVSLLATPVLAATPQNFRELIQGVLLNGILKPIVPVLIGLAVVVFIYGIITVMFSEGGEKKESGKQYMMWGILGIFVMVSVWGLVYLLGNTLELNLDPRHIDIVAP
jgi:hypothetical protein